MQLAGSVIINNLTTIKKLFIDLNNFFLKHLKNTWTKWSRRPVKIYFVLFNVELVAQGLDFPDWFGESYFAKARIRQLLEVFPRNVKLVSAYVQNNSFEFEEAHLTKHFVAILKGLADLSVMKVSVAVCILWAHHQVLVPIGGPRYSAQHLSNNLFLL